jgi:hypothetical protein
MELLTGCPRLIHGLCKDILQPLSFVAIWNQSVCLLGLKLTNSLFPPSFCSFNQLDLHKYTSKEQLQERLLLAIHEANEGFGFG